MKLYLDDDRETPEGYTRCYWPDEVIAHLTTPGVVVEEISLDHDLGDDLRGTGYDVVTWIEEQVVLNGYRPPVLKVHSANTSAALRMRAGIDNIRYHYQKHEALRLAVFDAIKLVCNRVTVPWFARRSIKDRKNYYPEGWYSHHDYNDCTRTITLTVFTRNLKITLTLPYQHRHKNKTAYFDVVGTGNGYRLYAELTLPSYSTRRRYIHWIYETLKKVNHEHPITLY